MKQWIVLPLLAATVATASALSFSFKPNDYQVDPDDLFDLEHQYAYGFGITTLSGTGKTLKDYLLGGYTITSARITIDNVWDWQVEQDYLYINLLDGVTSGVSKKEENPNDNYFSNYFGQSSRSTGVIYSAAQLLTIWSDPVGGYDRYFDFVYNLTSAQLGTLDDWITNGGTFGLGFDPDCHYFNKGIEFCIEIGQTPTPTQTVPDGGSTAILLGIALMGTAFWRRKLRGLNPAVAKA